MGEVRATIFRDGTLIDRAPIEAGMSDMGPSGFIWIDVQDPADADLAELQMRFRLHTLAVDDSMSRAQGPKLNRYDDQIFIVLKVAQLEGDEIRYSELNAFLSGQHIITVRHGQGADYSRARETVHTGPSPTRGGPDFVLHTIMDAVVESYFPVVEMIQDEVLSMQQQLLDGFLERDEITRLFRLRREAMHFQHVLARMSDVCGKLTNLDVPCIRADLRPYFRDVHDNLVRLDVMTSSLVEVIRAVFDASNLLEQQRQGSIMRRLAAWAAILAVPTAMSGIYGMNFPDIPEVSIPYARFVVIGAMVTICTILYVRFRKLRWL